MIKKNPAKSPASISYLSLHYFKLDTIMDSGLDCRCHRRTFETGLLNYANHIGVFCISSGDTLCKLLKHENNISYFMVI